MNMITLNRRLVLSGATVVLVAATAARVEARPQNRPAYDGLKKTIAVDLFQATETVGGSVTAEGMTAMLTQALVEDGIELPPLFGGEDED